MKTSSVRIAFLLPRLRCLTGHLLLLAAGVTVAIICALSRAHAQTGFSTSSLGAGADTNTAPPEGGSTAALTPREPFVRWGPLSVRPNLGFRFTHANAVLAGPGHTASVDIMSYLAGTKLELGERWTAEYQANRTLYSTSDFKNTLDHTASLGTGISRNDWDFRFVQRYTSAATPLVETGEQIRQQSSVTTLSAAYRSGPRTGARVTLNQTLNFVERLPDPSEWSIDAEVHHEFAPRFRSALKLTTGYMAVAKASDTAFARPQVQFIWKPADKLRVDVTAGAERRRFLADAGSTHDAALFTTSVQYRPFPATQFIVSAERQVSPSLIRDRVSESPIWQAVFNQRLLKHIYFTARFEQQKTSFIPALTEPAPIRIDNRETVVAGFRVAFLKRASLSVSYRKMTNTSNIDLFTFSTPQLGAELTYKY